MIIAFHSLYIVVNCGLKIFKNRKRLENVMTPLFSYHDVLQAQEIVDTEENLTFDPPVYKQRYGEIQNILLDNVWKDDIKKIVDFGCAEFKLFLFLKRLIRIEHIFEVDIDEVVLQENIFRLYPLTVDYLCKRTEPLTVHVLCGSISDPDRRLLDVDVVIGIEIIEHLYPDTLDALPYNIFGVIIPKIAIFTTPNADFNQLFPNFKGFRHYDHKFEWTREQFESWAVNIVKRFPDYSVSFKGIGQGPKGTEKLGCCSQMAVFVKECVPKITDIKCQRENSVDIIRNYENCELPVSVGVCKYFSYIETISQSSNISLMLEHESYGDITKNADDHYKTIALVEYPYDIDERSTEQKILDELKYRIQLMGNINGRFYNEEDDRIEIPIIELIFNQYTTFTTVTEAREILEKAGFKIEECIVCKKIETCVIYEPEMESRSSTPVSGSRDDSGTDREYYAEWTAGTTEGETSDWEVDSDIQRGVWIVNCANQEMQGEALESANQIVHDLINNVELLTSTQEASALVAQEHLTDEGISNREEGKIFNSLGNSYDLTNMMYDSGYYKSNTNLTTSPQSCSDGLDADILDDSIHSEVNTSDKKPVVRANIVSDNEHAVFCKDFKLSCHKRKADAVDLTEDISLDSADRCHIDNNAKNFYVHDSSDDKSSFVKSAATVGALKVAINKAIVCNNSKEHSFKENIREYIPGAALSGASKECSPGTSESKKRKKSKKCESDDEDVAVNGLKIEGVDVKVRIDDRENREMDVVHEALEAVQVMEPIVENGDLANNNRDLEGNNYPNAQHDNEGNDNEHVVFQNIIEVHEIDERNEDIENRNADVEDDEANNEPEVDSVCLGSVQPAVEVGLEHASQEALFDPNSLVDLLENFDEPGLQNDSVIENLEEAVAQNVIVISLGGGSVENHVGPVIPIDAEPFPHWLLHLLGTDFADEDQHHDEPHFYCQGDGIGVHPSFIDGDFEEENTSSDSDSSSTAASGTGNSSNTTTNTVDAAEAVPTVSEADVGSLPEDANDVAQEQNAFVTQAVNAENLQSPVMSMSNAGSSSGTESADEFFDTVEDALSTNSSRSEKNSTASNQTKSLK